jgi:hypothetical protein
MAQVFEDEHLNRLTVVTDEAVPDSQRVLDASSFFACDIPDDLDFLLQDADVPKFNFPGMPGDEYTPQEVSDKLDDIIKTISDAVDNMDSIDDIMKGEEPYDGSYYQHSKDPEKEKEDEKEKNDGRPNEQDNEDGKGDIPEPAESAIIEFAADCIKADAEPHIWISKAGDPIDNETVIARCKQDDVMKPVKSIFKTGVVRKDPSDGSFGRLFKTVCSRHIIIDGIKDGKKHFLAADFDSSYLLQLESSLGYNMECFDLFTEQMPYLLYPKILSQRTMKKPRDASSLELRPFVSPREQFEKFIDGFLAIQDKYKKEICDLDSEDSIKGAGLDPGKQKDLGQGILDKREEYLDAVMEYCDKWEDVVEVCDTVSEEHPERFSFDGPVDVEVWDVSEGTREMLITDAGQGMDVYYDKMLRKVVGTPNDEEGDLMKQYRSMITSFLDRRRKIASSNHADVIKEYGDGSRLVLQETAEIEEFFAKMKTVYVTTSPSKCMEAIEKMKGKNIYAEWPEYTEYEYKGQLYRHYTFLNIDEYRDRLKVEDDDKDEVFPEDRDFDISSIKYPLGEDGLVDDRLAQEMLDGAGHAEGSAPASAPEDDREGDDEPIRPNEFDDGLSVDTDIPHSELKYWRRYCSVATLVTLPYLATGLVISGVGIPLPCIYTPLTVMSAPEIGSLVVVGLGIRGVMVLPMVIYVNYDDKMSTSVLGVLLAFDAVKNAFNMSLDKLDAVVPNVANVLIESFKSNNDALLRENQKIRVQQGEMEKLIKQIPNWSTIKKNCRKLVGYEARNVITRIDDKINAAGLEVENLIEDVEGNTLAIQDELQGRDMVNHSHKEYGRS